MEEGARQAIETCLNVVPEDRVIIVTDVATMDIGASLLERAKRITPNISFFILEDFGKRPAGLPDNISEALKNSTVSILAMQSVGGELESFRMPYIAIAREHKVRHAHMIGITQDIMNQGMSADYEQVRIFSNKVYDLVSGIKEARVNTALGTDMVARFASDMKWVISDGHITPESWSNLPDGEVWTCPARVDGRVVIDGVLGDHFSRSYGLLERQPIIVDIADSRIVKVMCDSEDMKRDFEQYIRSDENANRVGEFALGTNLALRSLIGNMLQYEKYPGVHIAFGHSYPERTGSNWSSRVHCDAVFQKPTVVIDGKTLMRHGEYMV